jgi:hypothetical protein
MKTHTQQQTNQGTETIATEQKFSHQKQQDYKPQKWRGNTLVPVIIALAISAIATIAFLNQGADLSTKNKIIIAQNEIASALSDWVVIREANGVGSTANAPKPADRSNIFDPSGTTFMRLAAAITTAGAIVPIMTQHSPYMTYETDKEASCNILRDRLSNKIDGFLTGHCINTALPASGSTAGKFLLIVLN